MSWEARDVRKFTYQVSDDTAIDPCYNHTQIGAQDKEYGVQNKQKHLFGVVMGEKNLRNGTQLSKELVIDTDFFHDIDNREQWLVLLECLWLRLIKKRSLGAVE